jgi:hypothetical protein
MVHPYLRRRRNPEKVEYPSPEGIATIRTNCAECPRQDPMACRSSRNRRCARHHRGRISRPKRPMVCAAPWRPSAMSAPCATFEEKMVGGMTDRGYPEEFSQRCFDQIKVSAAMVSPKAMRSASRFWSMPRPSSRNVTRRPSARRCLIRSRWGSMRRPRSSAARAIMAWRCARSTRCIAIGTIRWRWGRMDRRCGWGFARSTDSRKSGRRTSSKPVIRAKAAIPVLRTCKLCMCLRRPVRHPSASWDLRRI